MILSLNPTYYCNFRNGKCAETCYLTSSQLSDPKILDVKDISARVTELEQQAQLEHIDLYGGEITILPIDYQYELLGYLAGLSCSLNLVTNLSNVNSPFIHHRGNDFTLSVSWDYRARQGHEAIYEKMKTLSRDFTVLSLASPEFMTFSPLEILKILNQLPFLSAFEIKPYNQNQGNALKISHRAYEKLIQSYVEIYRSRSWNFSFTNLHELQNAIEKNRRSWSDNHIYLTPANRWAVLDFDQQGREYFLHLQDLNEYQSWAKNEKATYTIDPHCQECRFLGHCLSEHLKPINDFESTSCSGFKNLLDWFEKSAK
ncbi:hypothetical protein [Peredibacter starrii]|uniref:Radical SAM protein n=1 Tax=Peredibacter starrii TaxID=28202 RepID=A0AAX4HR18_9BACT|nr:hypothetical protein [Peredibacter starrii]WPU65622.1 hypothetical protein SOO65_02560 [Peredibacter starrii]